MTVSRSKKIVVITGSTSGIGAAIARAFGRSGARVFLVGRSEVKLASVARKVPARSLAGIAQVDLASIADVRRLVAMISDRLPRVDVLVQAAGEYGWTEAGSIETEGLDLLFGVNVRAPYVLTQGLLPLLERARGQAIFVNSSVVRSPGQGVAVYKATRHALQGLVDSLRQDFNRHGIRVSSLFPGRTATTRMRQIYAREGKRYAPEALMNAADVARVVVALTELPAGVEVTDIHLRSPTPY
jgi:NADP-dependent 3-hydroxy acid dehydrogenase YdfG